MKRNQRLALACAALFVISATSGVRAQQPANPATNAPSKELLSASEALQKGDEAIAWQLFTQSGDAFAGQWPQLDGAFVTWVADQYRKQKRYPEALGVCNMVLAKESTLKPEYAASVLLAKGDVFRDQENFSAARLEYQSIDRNKAYKPTDAGQKARFRIVDILRMTKDYDGAQEILEQMKDVPDRATQAEVYYNSARVAFDRGSYEDARGFIEEVKKRVPEHVEALFLEAELNLKEDRLQDPELEVGSKVLTTYVTPYRQVTMKMQDRNLAVVRGGAGIPVRLKTSKGGDMEIVTLLPSPRDPTMFRGSISTRLGDAIPTNMFLEVNGDDVVSYNLLESFQKENDLDYKEKKMLVVADAELTATAGDFIAADARDAEILNQRMQTMLIEAGKKMKAYERHRDTTVVRPGNDIRIQVKDFDRDVSAKPDKVYVDAETSTGDKVPGVELVETNAHSGVFRGRLPTSIAPPRATASDSAAGKNPGAVLRKKDAANWASAADSKKPKWLEVDLMNINPLDEASLELGEGTTLSAVSLMAGVADAQMKKVASLASTPEEINGYVDLTAHFGSEIPLKTAAYLYAEITSEEDADAALKIGSCDGVTCWVNKLKVHENLVDRRMWKPEEDPVNVKLKKGVNGILVKVTHRMTGPWGVSVRVLDKQGDGLAAVKARPPAKAGVVTQWYVFDRLTPEEIQVPERIQVNKPIRIKDQLFRWVGTNVGPRAVMKVESNMVKTVFYEAPGVRKLRWVFDEFGGSGVTVAKVHVKNRFGESLLPSDTDFSTASSNRVLELSPGDRITISYNDEHRTRGESLVLTAPMNSGFHNGHVAIEYETITMNKQGERVFAYDGALRYRPGKTEGLMVRVVDYDEDVSNERDKMKVVVETTSGEKLNLEDLETEEHSGEFMANLKLGAATDKDTVKVNPGDVVKVTYLDRENSDGQMVRTASISDAGNEAPELLLYQSLLIMGEKGITDDNAAPIAKVRLPPGGESTNGLPVVTSMDTTLLFKVVYPAAALSSNAVFTARLVTDRELADAKGQNRDPKYLEVPMKLTDPVDGEFEAQVELRTGNESDYVDQQGGSEKQKETAVLLMGHDFFPVLYVHGDDLINVIAKGVDGNVTREGKYRLASDGMLTFTDRKYEKPVDQVYVGDFLYVRLADRDRDVSDGLDHVKVLLSTKSDKRELTLTETLPHSGVFSGRTRTELASAAAPEAPESGSDTGVVVKVEYGGTITGTYQDQVSVLSAQPHNVMATVAVYKGADGALATFTKQFADQDIAVKTRLLTAEALFELAKDHRKAGQKDLAEDEITEGKAILAEAIADYPETKHAPQAEFLLANLAQELENYEEALGRYNKVISTWPDSEYAPKSQLKKGVCLEKLNDFENALDAYVELTYSYPNSPLVPDAVIRLGQYFYRVKKYEIAGKIFGNFQARNPSHELAAKSLFLAGQSYLKGADDRKQEIGGRYDNTCQEWLQEGIQKFERLIATYEDKDLRAESMYWLSDCHMKVGDTKNAYQTLKKLTWDYPESKWAKFARGQLVQNESTFQAYDKEQ